MGLTAQLALVVSFLPLAPMSGVGDRSAEQIYTEELWDLSNYVVGLSTTDLSRIGPSAGVPEGTPAGSMFLWDTERLSRASKWRGAEERVLIGKLAKVILALRDLRDVARVNELGAQPSFV